MQIQNNNISFNGGYKFIKMPKEARTELERLVPKGKTVYDCFEDKPSNVFLVTRGRYHNIITGLIKNYNLNCRYYPEVKLDSGSVPKTQKEILKIIQKMQPKKIIFSNGLSDAIEHRARVNFDIEHGREHLQNILNTLKLDMDESTYKVKYGAKIFKNSDHTKDIYVSALSRDRIHYVKINHLVSSSNQRSVEMYAMSPDGEILRNYTNDIDNWATFNKKFNATLIK